VRFVPTIRRLAFSMSRRTGGRFPAEDLVGVGFLALVEAHVRFDATLGVAFDAYAALRIRGAMLDELRSVDPISRSARRFKRTRDDAVTRLGMKLERPPSQEEIASELNMSLDAYQASLAAVAVETVSIDTPREHDGAAWAQPLASEEPTPEERALESESARRVECAVAALPPRLRQVLDMYFGENRTMRDIGAVLGVSESRISQLVTHAIGRVREGLSENDAPTPRRAEARTTGVRRKNTAMQAAVR
jgi:RNA polymerase sigma factor for flagellar operon FliA